MAEGVSTYKCHSCSKRQDPDEAKLNATATDTPQKGAMKDGEEEGSNNGSTVQSSFLEMLFLSLTAKVDLLVGTVTIMREENAMIRSELQQAKSLWPQLVRDAPKITDRAAPRAHKSYAAAMSSQNTTENSRHLDNDAGRAKEKTAGQNIAPPSQACASGSVREHASSIVEDPSFVTGSVTDDRFQLVTRNKRRQLAKVGACTNDSLSSIPRPPVKRALFVTRLSPDTTCEDVNNYPSS
ncbi:hypothetical protein HPB47_009430, partial [Ixodes persulcatus]